MSAHSLTNTDDIDEQYCRTYAELCAQVHAKHFSDKSLSGKEALTSQVVTVKGTTFSFSSISPVESYVKTQRLSPELERLLSTGIGGAQIFGCASVKLCNGAPGLFATASGFQGEGRGSLMGMNAWERHKHFVANYVKFYGGEPPSDVNQTIKTDWDVLRENYRFIREDGDDAPGSWEVQLAKKYYRKLFREYAVADLSRYKEGKLGLRWRIEKEVVSGKGQFACGAKGCNEHGGLASFEVNFVYEEAGAAKAALVKLRLCPKHALQLNYQKNQLALQAQLKKQNKRSRKDKSSKCERKTSCSPSKSSGAVDATCRSPSATSHADGRRDESEAAHDDVRGNDPMFQDMFD